MRQLRTWQKSIIYVIFCLSGFSALVYEVLWTKHLSLAFGTTMIAVSIVAATFMGGLALGSHLFGRFSDQKRNLLRLYAYLELGIVAFALLFTPTLKIVNIAYASLARTTPDAIFINHFFHIFFAALLLLPPTICMGGTFPIICRFFARNKSGGQIGRLYAINTLGAAIGAFLCGYFLIPELGKFTTTLLAASLNLVCAVVAWSFSKPIETSTPKAGHDRDTAQGSNLSRANRPVLVAIALIGFLALGYEILWTRLFLLFLGNTTYAFSLILSSFLISITIGGAIYARLAHPDLNEKKLFVRLSIFMGLSIALMFSFYDQLAHVFLWLHTVTHEQWWLLSLLSALVVFGVVCLPIIVSGCLLPAAVAIINPGRFHTGEGVGMVVLYNTLGAVAGSLVAGFLLVPLFGLQNSFSLLACFNLIFSATLGLVFFSSSFKRVISIPIACGLGFVLLIISPRWDQGLLNSGVYIYAPKYQRNGGIEKVLQSEKILKVIEGIDANVAIFESIDGRFRFFTVNGKTDGGIGRDMATQILVGHLPMLLHPHPQEVLVIGLGTGVTLRGLSNYPTDAITCVEISSEVVEASYYFNKANDFVLNDSKVSLLIDDGRNYLQIEEKQFDVVISEPSNPWQTGNSNLFTHEFYQLAASRLKPGGLFAQWIGIYDITPENLSIAINTILQTFPEALAFRSGTDLIIVGSKQELQFDYMNMKTRMKNPDILETLKLARVDSPGDILTQYYLFGENCLQKFSFGSQLNTDNQPVLEFSAKDILGTPNIMNLQMENMKALIEAGRSTVLPIKNLGKDIPTTVNSLNELSFHYQKEGRPREAQYFAKKAQELAQR